MCFFLTSKHHLFYFYAKDSLSDFLECDGTRTKLLYELASSLEGASQLRRLDNGILEQRHPQTNKVTWMKVLNIPSLPKQELVHFEEYMKQKVHQGTFVKVFSQGLNMSLPSDLCEPFAFIYGKRSDDVGKATGIIAGAIHGYRQRTQNKAQQQESLPQGLESSLVSSRKREVPIDHNALSAQRNESFSSTERPTKVPKVDENKSSKGATCTLTVPLWAMQRCYRDNELFCKTSLLCLFIFYPTCPKLQFLF